MHHISFHLIFTITHERGYYDQSHFVITWKINSMLRLRSYAVVGLGNKPQSSAQTHTTCKFTEPNLRALSNCCDLYNSVRRLLIFMEETFEKDKSCLQSLLEASNKVGSEIEIFSDLIYCLSLSLYFDTAVVSKHARKTTVLKTFNILSGMLAHACNLNTLLNSKPVWVT